ncbi:hypothetical protein CJF42_09105 [Pseudoalteromonas sp. NBT06-2]|uniref:Rho-binding antiterminator n=1 Tax=Pseudoalteromonas sp. NBT06-2 TaxID=2025950 RepID=UPI000BA6B92F|nr:Rho-binding antiterminator [Pseudoalteromonas sp. NBT06-2]PAJ74709.1 hypothetical protein CJF42_09105 [Pseudoalteromonas sp. NBT06-2]
MSNLILKCDLHDYLEIACIYKITVELTLKNGVHIVGTPITTGVNKESGEYLVVQIKHGVEDVSIPLLSLQSMRAISSNSHFDKIEFTHE